MKRVTQRTLLPTAIALAAFQAHGAGFQISEHSASGLGRAFAGEAAIADNAAVAARNPAAMTMFDSAQASGGLSYIEPEVDTTLSSSSVTVSGTDIPTGGETYSDVAPSAVVPYFHYIRPLNDQMAIGFSTFSNFGLASEYPSNAIAGPGAGESELLTIDFNANFAYEINKQWSVAAGINAVYADASLTRNAGNLATGLTKLGYTSNETAHLEGDGWGFGWNLGALWQINENNRLGLAYRSKVDVTLEGNYRGTSAYFAGKPVGTTVPGELELNLPDILEFSGYHKVAPKWAVHYSAVRTGWSGFEELRATSAATDCVNSGTEPGVCLQKDEKWDDSWRYAVGATHYLNNQWTLRAGFAYDESPVPNDHKTMSIPDTDRYWYSFGATFEASDNLTIDGGFSYVNGDSDSATESEGAAKYVFEAGGDAYIFAIGANYTF